MRGIDLARPKELLYAGGRRGHDDGYRGNYNTVRLTGKPADTEGKEE